MPFPDHPAWFDKNLTPQQQEQYVRIRDRMNEEYGRTVITEKSLEDALDTFLATAHPSIIASIVNSGITEANKNDRLNNQQAVVFSKTEAGREKIINSQSFLGQVGKLQEAIPIQFFDINDAADIVDQLTAPYRHLGGTTEGDLVTSTVLDNFLDNTTRGIGDLNALRQEMIPEFPFLGALFTDMENSELDIDAHAETGGLDGIKLSQALDAMVENGVWTQAEADAVVGKTPSFFTPNREGEIKSPVDDNVLLSQKLAALIENVQDPILNREIRDRSGTYQEGFKAVLDSSEEFAKLQRGEETLITLPQQIAEGRLQEAAAQDLRELATNSDTDKLVQEILNSTPGYVSSSNLTGDAKTAAQVAERVIKNEVQAASANLTPDERIAKAQDAVGQYDELFNAEIARIPAETVSTETGANTARNNFLFSAGVNPTDLTPERLRFISQAIQGFGGVTAEFEQWFGERIQGFQQEKVNQDFQKLTPQKQQAEVLGRAGFPTLESISPDGVTGGFGGIRQQAFANEAVSVSQELRGDVLRAIEADPAADALAAIPQFGRQDINLLGQRFGIRGPGFDPVPPGTSALTRIPVQQESFEEPIFGRPSSRADVVSGPPSPSLFAPVRPSVFARGLEEAITVASEGAPEGFEGFLRAEIPNLSSIARRETSAGNRPSERFRPRFNEATGKIERISLGTRRPTFQATTRTSSILRRERESLLTRFNEERREREFNTPAARRRRLRSFGGSRIRGVIGRV